MQPVGSENRTETVHDTMRHSIIVRFLAFRTAARFLYWCYSPFSLLKNDEARRIQNALAMHLRLWAPERTD